MAIAQKEDISDMYEESRKRILTIRKLLGDVQEGGPFPFPVGTDYETLQTYLNSILGSHRFERAGLFRTTIIETGEWLLAAIGQDYLATHSTLEPHPIYVISEGIRSLELLLQRLPTDREFNAPQMAQHNKFLSLIRSLPEPRKARLSQMDVDTLVEQTLGSEKK